VSNDCGCCTVVSPNTQTENRPWLSAVAYRIGTFATFRKAIVDELSHTPELAGLTARVSDDYTITAIELWVAVADVLTFYQERIANEAFLRTATLRDSVLRLVRLIDYQLSSGAAATTQLAFTLDTGAKALIPAGTRSQSVPGEGEKPQKFETLAALLADARLNRLRLFPTAGAASPTSIGTAAAIIAPDADAIANAATLAAGDRVILYAPTALEILTVRDVKPSDDVMTVRWQTPISSSAFTGAYDASDATRRAYKLGRSFHLFGFDAPEVVVVPAQSNPADATTTYLTQAKTNFSLHGDGTTATQISLDARYTGLKPGAIVLAVSTVAGATRAIPFMVESAGESLVKRTAASIPTILKPLVVIVTSQSGTVSQLTLIQLGAQSLANLLPTDDIRDVVIHELTGDALRFWPHAYPHIVASSDVYLPGRRNGWSSIEVGRTIEKGAYKPGTSICVTDLPAGRAVLLTDARNGAPIAATVVAASLTGLDLSFAPTDTDAVTVAKLGLAPGEVTPITALVSAQLASSVPIPAALRELQVTIGTLPPQTISLAASLPSPATLAQVAAAMQTAIRAALRTTPSFSQACVYAMPFNSIAVVPGMASDRVSIAPSTSDPATVVALGFDSGRVRWLDGLMSAKIAVPAAFFTGHVRVRVGIDPPTDLPFGLAPANVQSIANAIAFTWGLGAAARDDDRLIVLPHAPTHEPRSFVHLSLDLDGNVGLDAATAMLLGNVAPASHGETVHNEIVGDGDASLAFQRFALKKKPLSYVPAATAGGVASSLTLLVNGVRWSEVPTLYGASPLDPVYITRIGEDGTTTVHFGDGTTGARVPTGRQNIVATYRQGLGIAGRVGAAKITALLDRPTGVKNVVNLVAADGGADPETMDKAREAAPGTVRTFGRAVSLRDFQDTALMAGEVAKAAATWVWAGERRAIHLTIAAQGGATFSADGLKRTAATLLSEREPNHKLLIDNYTAVAVLIDASILVDARYVTADVLAAARTALLFDLAFDRRRFAQPVYLSEIFAVLQNVAGVVAVDVNTLDLKSTDPTFRAAHGIDPALGQPQPHLLMLPARPAGTGTVLPAELAWVEVPAQDVILRATGGLSL
jgi:hypothetical protein